MRRVSAHIGILFLVLILQSCYLEEDCDSSYPDEALELPYVLKFDTKNCAFDAKNNLLRYSVAESELADFAPYVEFREGVAIQFEKLELRSNQINKLGKIEIAKPYAIRFTADEKVIDFQLIFTKLPIIELACDSKVFDEPKTLARIQISTPQEASYFNDFVGLEYRGKFSRSFPKKSYGFSLWGNGQADKEYVAKLMQIGPNSDWILNSSVIDPSRIRNAVSFELWSKMENTGPTLETQHHSIVCSPVELFFNNEFRGLYLFSENMNHFLLKADESAVLYKSYDWADGATRFEHFNAKLSSNQYWNGWEQKFPDRKQQINWEPLKTLYKLVVDANDADFAQNIESLIDVPLLIDYFLLLNLTAAADNTGKNIFLFKNSASDKFQIIPWDLDGCWGIQYDGERVSAENILSNNLFQRLYNTNPNNYREKLKERWFELRAGVFSEDSLNQLFNGYFELMRSTNIIEMENRQWNLSLNIKDEQIYIENWISKRLQFLDTYFNNFAE